MMNFDGHTVQIIILIIVNIVLLTGTYWKMRIEVDKRPTYEKVEQMIKRDTPNEQRIEEIVKRDAFAKSDGASLLTEIKNIKTMLDHVSRKLDTYFKPRKEMP